MNRHLLINRTLTTVMALLLLLCLACVPASAQTGPDAQVMADVQLRLRAASSTTSPILTLLDPLTPLTPVIEAAAARGIGRPADGDGRRCGRQHPVSPS